MGEVGERRERRERRRRRSRAAEPADRRRRRARGEAAASSSIALVVSLAVFMLGTGVLAAFALQPASVAKPSDALLRARAEDLLDVIARTPGVPAEWAASAHTVQNVTRVGLLENGYKRTLDEGKFYALSRSGWSNAGDYGTVDYEDLRRSLGVSGVAGAEGYHFQLRTTPRLEVDNYGTDGMSAFRVAYIGDYSGTTEQSASSTESATIDGFGVSFTNTRRTSSVEGDKYRDDSGDLRDLLAPRLNLTLDNVSLATGSGALPSYLLSRTHTTSLTTAGYAAPPEGSFAVAIASGSTLGYQKNKDFRTVVGYADLSSWSGGTAPRATWYEIVEGEGTNSTSGSDTHTDYGVVEAWDGTAWVTLNPAAATPAATRNPSVHSIANTAAPVAGSNPTTWARHTVDFGLCTGCMSKDSVPIALRWVASNDNTMGVGWFVDDFKVQLAGGTGATVLAQGFEQSYYQAVVVGSNVDQNAMTSAQVKYSIRDYVKGGGTLIVLGGSNNINWLKPFVSASITAGAGASMTAPDEIHPFLTSPSSLNYDVYSNGNAAWTFTSGGGADFTNVVEGTSSSGHVVAVSVDEPSWGGTGRIILSTFYPHQMASTDASMFLGNAITFGRYGWLYLDFGPSVPRGVPVASATATGVMDSARVGTGETVRMELTLYVWS